jgi:hypothetical protein
MLSLKKSSVRKNLLNSNFKEQTTNNMNKNYYIMMVLQHIMMK